MFSKIKKNYFLLISTFLILYFSFNLFGGERGFFSYFEKKEYLINPLDGEVDQVKINYLSPNKQYHWNRYSNNQDV